MANRTRDSRQLRKLTRIMVCCGIVLLLLLAGFQSLPLFYNMRTPILDYIDVQSGLSQRIAKDILVLAYRPKEEYVQAINELQNMLPYWEKVQYALQNGDEALNIPPNPPDAEVALYTQEAVDFVDIDTASHTILNNRRGPADPVEVQIVLQHERNYYLVMRNISLASRADTQDKVVRFVEIELFIDIALLLLAICFLVIAERWLGRMATLLTTLVPVPAPDLFKENEEERLHP